MERDWVKLPSTRAEIVMLLQTMNPLHNVFVIHERSKIISLQNIKPASVTGIYRAG